MLSNILFLYPEYDTIYGPYIREDNRKHIVLYSTITNKRRTLSYPKALIESYLGRVLLDNETVDHKDRNKENDSIGNLQILTRVEHATIDATRRKTILVLCPMCDTLFTPSRHQLDKRNSHRAGPFCSRSCSSKYSRAVQLGKINPMQRTSDALADKEYYKLDK